MTHMSHSVDTKLVSMSLGRLSPTHSDNSAESVPDHPRRLFSHGLSVVNARLSVSSGVTCSVSMAAGSSTSLHKIWTLAENNFLLASSFTIHLKPHATNGRSTRDKMVERNFHLKNYCQIQNIWKLHTRPSLSRSSNFPFSSSLARSHHASLMKSCPVLSKPTNYDGVLHSSSSSSRFPHKQKMRPITKMITVETPQKAINWQCFI